MNSSSTVSAELGLRLVVPQQTVVPLVASLYYSKEDPYAIRIAFHVGLDEPVEWIFAWMYSGLIPNAVNMKSIELFKTRVLPAFE